MEIYQLRAFVAVARHGNFTKAASELHLSQPTVSGQIKALEEDLGVLLFERRASGVVTTATGAALLPKAEKLLADVRGFKAHARQMGAQLPAKILLGTVIDARFLRLGQFMSAMRARHPQVEIETHHGLSGWVMNAVRKGDLDCGFFVGPVRQADVTATLLTEMTYRIVAPCDWAVRIADAGWAEIAAMPWIWAPEEGSYPQIAMEMFREHGVEPNKVAVADRESTIINLVTAGVGLALLREDVALSVAASNELVLWENGSRKSTLSFVHLKERGDEPAIAGATEIVREVWVG